MVVGRRFRYVFIEVPHTGSTAVATELCESYGGDPLYHKHSNYAEFWHLASDDERRFFSFAGVRNPLDAIVTDYLRYRMNPNGQYTDPKMLAENGGWVRKEHLERFDFVIAGNDFSAYFERYYRSAKVHFNWYLAAHRPFDIVLRKEHLQEDFSRALAMMNVPEVRPIPVKNVTSERQSDFYAQYEPSVRPLAKRIFGPFMKQWGYEFPEAWGNEAPPRASTLAYEAMGFAARNASRVVRLGPHDPRILALRTGIGALRGR